MNETAQSTNRLGRFKPYPEYKDSKIQWLGNIAKHWDVKPVKFLANADNSGVWGNEPEDCELPLPVATTAHIKPDGSLLIDQMPRRCLTSTEASYYRCRVGDIVVVKSSGSATNVISGKAGLVGQEEEGMVFSNFLLRLRPLHDRIDPRILFRFLTSGIVQERIRVMVSTTTYPNLRVGEYLRFEVPLPPKAEQRAIAAFLDRETGRIDELVAKKERLIELLQEKRSALITHAVTKGLAPNAPMKPSGIDWLGNIPAHWEVRRLNHLVVTRKGIAFRADDFADDGVPVVKASDIKETTIRTPSTFLPPEFVLDCPKAVLRADELILSTVGSAPEVRNSAVGQLGRVPHEISGSLLNQNTVVYSPHADMLMNDYLYYLIQTTGYRDHLDLHAHGTANQASLNVSDMLDIYVPIPKPEEQAEISDYIGRWTLEMDELFSWTERAVGLLKEYRTALISAAVTGKIDIREEAA